MGFCLLGKIHLKPPAPGQFFDDLPGFFFIGPAMFGRHGEMEAADTLPVFHGVQGLKKMFLKSRARAGGMGVKQDKSLGQSALTQTRLGQKTVPNRPIIPLGQ